MFRMMVLHVSHQTAVGMRPGEDFVGPQDACGEAVSCVGVAWAFAQVEVREIAS